MAAHNTTFYLNPVEAALVGWIVSTGMLRTSRIQPNKCISRENLTAGKLHEEVSF